MTYQEEIIQIKERIQHSIYWMRRLQNESLPAAKDEDEAWEIENHIERYEQSIIDDQSEIEYLKELEESDAKSEAEDAAYWASVGAE